MSDRLRMAMLTGAICVSAIISACETSTAEAWHERWDVPLAPLQTVLEEMHCAELEAAIVAHVDDITSLDQREDRLEKSVLVQAAFHRMVQLDCAEAYQP